MLLLVAVELEEEAIFSGGLQQFLNRPDVVCDSRLHGGRHPERLMHPAEIEKGHVEVNGGFQMFECLAESQAQPRKAPKMCPHAQIRPLDVTRSYLINARTLWKGQSLWNEIDEIEPNLCFRPTTLR